MTTRLRRWLLDAATPRSLVAVLLGCVWLTTMFDARNEHLNDLSERTTPAPRSLCAFGAATRTVDGLCFYHPGVIKELAQSYGPAGRSFYAKSELTLDVVFPLAYGLLFALALTWAFSRAFAATSPLQRLPLLLPAVTVVADLCENASLVFLLTRDVNQPVVAWLNVAANAVKWVAFDVAVLLLAFAVLRWALKRPAASAAPPRYRSSQTSCIRPQL